LVIHGLFIYFLLIKFFWLISTALFFLDFVVVCLATHLLSLLIEEQLTAVAVAKLIE